MFEVVLVRFSAEVGGAIRREPVDVAEARGVAGLIAQYGAQKADSVPQEVADAFQTELTPVETSLANLEEGKGVNEVVTPMDNDRSVAAREALADYDCG